MHQIIETTLASSLATAGTLALDYPDGMTEGDFALAAAHKIVALQYTWKAPNDFTITLGDSQFTITWKASATLPAGTKLTIQLEQPGREVGRRRVNGSRAALAGTTAILTAMLINLGTPATLDADAFIKAATSTELPNAETVTYTPDTNGTSPTDGVGPVVTRNGVDYWELDVPRNITAAATHGSSVVAMTIVVTGLDVYENDVVESLSIAATGTSQTAAGLKAFKWVRSIAITAAGNAEANTLNMGFGDVLGLPVFIPSAACILKELEDGAAASAGTGVAGSQSAPTATTGDVRGTYDPNSACNGSKNFSLVVWLADDGYLGATPYAG